MANGPAISQLLRLATMILLCCTTAGCRVGGLQTAAKRPTRHSVRSDQFVVLSDFKLSKDHELIRDLARLREQVSEKLDLPLQREEVVVYIFSDELGYKQFLNTAYPGLPERRAYFVGTPRELAVYSYWGERIREDLQHEFTHGLLHASLKQVPLWLDEGLAEYFEVAGPKPGTINAEHSHQLAGIVANGWRPDLERLEQLEEFSQMQRIDYQESWAWVHYMLHSTPEARGVLLSYLRDLRNIAEPEPLSKRLGRDVPQFKTRFLNYVTSLHSTRQWVGQH